MATTKSASITLVDGTDSGQSLVVDYVAGYLTLTSKRHYPDDYYAVADSIIWLAPAEEALLLDYLTDRANAKRDVALRATHARRYFDQGAQPNTTTQALDAAAIGEDAS